MPLKVVVSSQPNALSTHTFIWISSKTAANVAIGYCTIYQWECVKLNHIFLVTPFAPTQARDLTCRTSCSDDEVPP